MRDLPGPVAEAGLLFQRTTIAGDPVAMRQIIDWGHQQIDLMYPEDAVRAPLNAVRRLRAHNEWNKVIRTAGKELRGTIVTAMVRELEFAIQRRQDQILAEDAERRRQEAEQFNSAVRVRELELINEINSRMRVVEHRTISQINHDLAMAEKRLEHELHQAAEDAASRRRQQERVLDTQQKINELTAAAIVNMMGPNPTDRVIEAARKAGHEIAAIRADPSLTDDDKHLQIQIILQALPRTFSDLRARDV